jgi:hypothetical protein
MANKEPLEPIDRIDPDDPIDRIDPDDPTDSSEPTEKAEPNDNADATEAPDRTEPHERHESSDDEPDDIQARTTTHEPIRCQRVRCAAWVGQRYHPEPVEPTRVVGDDPHPADAPIIEGRQVIATDVGGTSGGLGGCRTDQSQLNPGAGFP